MSDEDKLGDLLVAWGNEREQGNDLSAQELCKDCPELADEMASRIRALRAMSWLMEPDDNSDDGFLSLPDFITGAAVLLPSSLSLEDFAGRIVESGLMTAEELDEFQDTVLVEDAQQLANELIREKKLTAYQARTLGEGNVRGLVLGNYVILDKIGSGGMGQVFKARHKRMKRRVAIKILPPGAMDTPKAVDRFQREVEAAAKLEHPNIVTAHDADEAEGVHFLVMQYVDGDDLSTIVKQQGPLSVAKAVRCIVQAARGLQYAHDEGVTHRDVKPANLLLDKAGNIKLLDMGLARIDPAVNGDGYVATQAELTQPDAVMGTVDYMSPEQAVDTKHADARADIYSLGCTLHYILTGKPPYKGNTLMARMVAHREADIPSLSDEREDVSEQLDNIFKRMLAKNPEERYPTMTALLEDLEVVADELDSLAEGEDDAAASVQSVTDIRSKDTAADTLMETLPSIRPMPAPVRSIPAKLANPRTKWRVIAGGGVAVLLLAALGYWLFGVIFKIDTGNGLIQIETNVADVEVFVDDEKVVHITDPKDKTKIKVEVAPGGKTLKVSKDGFEADVTEFKLNTVKGPIKVTFVPVKDLPPTSGTREKLLTATPGDRIDLLKLIDVERDAVAGDWKIVDSALVSPSEWPDERHLPRIVLPHSVPDEYDLHIVTDPERGRTFLGIGLVVGNSQVMLWFDDYHGKSSVCKIDGEIKEFYQGRLLKPGIPSRIVCSVRKGTIQVSCNETVLWDWTGDFSLVSLDKRGWKIPDTSKLFVATRDGAVHKISEISLIPISGEPSVTPPTAIPAAKTPAVPDDASQQ